LEKPVKSVCALKIDAMRRRSLDSDFIFETDCDCAAIGKQAREAGKAVRFGRGPATVIGVFVTGEGAVSQATLPAAEAELFARKSVAQALRDLVGLFYF